MSTPPQSPTCLRLNLVSMANATVAQAMKHTVQEALSLFFG